MTLLLRHSENTPAVRTLGWMESASATCGQSVHGCGKTCSLHSLVHQQLLTHWKSWYSPCRSHGVFSGLCRIREEVPLDKASSQSPEGRIMTMSEFIQRPASAYYNQTASHYACVSVGKCPHLSVSQALHLWSGAAAEQAAGLLGGVIKWIYKELEQSLARIRALWVCSCCSSCLSLGCLWGYGACWGA